jgi:hypothetical protein
MPKAKYFAMNKMQKDDLSCEKSWRTFGHFAAAIGHGKSDKAFLVKVSNEDVIKHLLSETYIESFEDLRNGVFVTYWEKYNYFESGFQQLDHRKVTNSFERFASELADDEWSKIMIELFFQKTANLDFPKKNLTTKEFLSFDIVAAQKWIEWAAENVDRSTGWFNNFYLFISGQPQKLSMYATEELFRVAKELRALLSDSRKEQFFLNQLELEFKTAKETPLMRERKEAEDKKWEAIKAA